MEALIEMQREGADINFNTVCAVARVSKTFLYDPKHSDLAQQIRSLRQVTPHSTAINRPEQIRATQPRTLRLSASKNASMRLRNEFAHYRKKTNCSTVN
jgi:hypothetical protein